VVEPTYSVKALEESTFAEFAASAFLQEAATRAR
jgi:hypothetical protein